MTKITDSISIEMFTLKHSSVLKRQKKITKNLHFKDIFLNVNVSTFFNLFCFFANFGKTPIPLQKKSKLSLLFLQFSHFFF